MPVNSRTDRSFQDYVAGSDPARTIELKESVALALIAALQLLTAPQRAVLLLRDVAALSAEEAADALDSISSVYREVSPSIENHR